MQIFSGAKFPAAEEFQYFVSLYANPNRDLLECSFCDNSIREPHPAVNERTLKEKQEFYNVRLDASKRRQLKSKEMPEEGLGKLPWDITSVSSLLLFNTSENP